MDGFPFELILFSETMLQMWTDFARFGDPNGDPQQVKRHSVKSRLKKSSSGHNVVRGGICPCRHCRRQCKIFASLVNFSIFTAERNFRLEPWTDDGLRSERRHHKVNRLTKNCSPTLNLTDILGSSLLSFPTNYNLSHISNPAKRSGETGCSSGIGFIGKQRERSLRT